VPRRRRLRVEGWTWYNAAAVRCVPPFAKTSIADAILASSTLAILKVWCGLGQNWGNGGGWK